MSDHHKEHLICSIRKILDLIKQIKNAIPVSSYFQCLRIIFSDMSYYYDGYYDQSHQDPPHVGEQRFGGGGREEGGNDGYYHPGQVDRCT